MRERPREYPEPMPTTHIDENALVQELNVALREGQPDLDPGLSDRLIDWVLDAVIAGDAAAIAIRRTQISRLERKMVRPQANSGPTSSAAADPDQVVSLLARVLRRAAPATISRQVAAQAQEQTATVRDQVLELLSRKARRPTRIAMELGCDPAQVSRALQELLAADRVMQVDPPPGQTDGRALWYRAIDAPVPVGTAQAPKAQIFDKWFQAPVAIANRIRAGTSPVDTATMERILAAAPETRPESSIDDVVARVRHHQPGQSNTDAKTPAEDAVPEILLTGTAV